MGGVGGGGCEVCLATAGAERERMGGVGGCEVCLATAGAERNSNVKKFRHKDTDGKTFRLTETQTKIHSD